MKSSFLFFVCMLLSSVSLAQANYQTDVVSTDAIIKALYNVISGDAGEARNWDRFRNLFTADARLIPTGKDKDGNVVHRVMTPDEYVTMFTSRINTGFHERELYQVKEEYGTIVHIFSTYETTEKKNGPVTNRGINSIQLIKSNDRYYILQILWCPESLGFPLPEKYLSR